MAKKQHQRQHAQGGNEFAEQNRVKQHDPAPLLVSAVLFNYENNYFCYYAVTLN